MLPYQLFGSLFLETSTIFFIVFGRKINIQYKMCCIFQPSTFKNNYSSILHTIIHKTKLESYNEPRPSSNQSTSLNKILKSSTLRSVWFLRTFVCMDGRTDTYHQNCRTTFQACALVCACAWIYHCLVTTTFKYYCLNTKQFYYWHTQIMRQKVGRAVWLETKNRTPSFSELQPCLEVKS